MPLLQESRVSSSGVLTPPPPPPHSESLGGISLPLFLLIHKETCHQGINWASEASPTLGCSIEISRDIYMYVGRYVCLSWSKKHRRKYVGQTRACSKSVLCGKIRPVTPVLLISTIRYSSFSMDGRETFT